MKRNIVFRQIDDEIENKLFEMYGEWLYEHDVIPKHDGSYNVAALCDGDIAGFAAMTPKKWTKPLDMYNDMFITGIEVMEKYRKQGIGRRLVEMLENHAKENGYRQIRAWSSEDKIAALNMWYSMNYAMCPAHETFLNEDGTLRKIVLGYKYAKMLNKGI